MASEGPPVRFPSLRPLPNYRPVGSYRGALILVLLAVSSFALLLYDLGVLWRSTPREVEGVASFVEPYRGDRRWVALTYEGEYVILDTEPGAPLPVEGQTVLLVVHRRYAERHIESARTPNAARPFYLEEPHALTPYGLAAALALPTFVILAGAQLWLARTQHRHQQRREPDELAP